MNFTVTSSFYTKEQLKRLTRDLPFLGDKAILFCIFEGIKGKSYSEIANMKPSHLQVKEGKFFVDLYGEQNQIRTDFEISSDLYIMLKELEKVYFYRSLRGKQIFLEESPYLFRRGNISVKKVGKKLPTTYFHHRAKTYKILFNRRDLKISEISSSGAMWFLNEWLLEADTRIVTEEMLVRLAEKYNFRQDKVKRLINKNFFIRTYGQFEYEDEQKKPPLSVPK